MEGSFHLFKKEFNIDIRLGSDAGTRRGLIVNDAFHAGIRGESYGAAKHALVGPTKTAAT